MKLRNKKTGEIGELSVDIDKPDNGIRVYIGVTYMIYNSLAELNEEWEDYEEPETYYYISDLGNIESLTNDHGQNLPEEIWHKAIKRRKEIGNHFETREEAEKALERLKALQRLKDKRFRFKGKKLDSSTYKHYIEFEVCSKDVILFSDDIEKDLDLLFGGKE